ncbi:hypothetical protein [uncultured Methylobacterium sp.]|uniref:hypothetical protein n=1 Tax=uncultured Methylobacterium sp. TaxID=157278 RepID=UPI002597C339|nr:hypothetical protein [uncultured Methylobacterium sp.]
MKVVFGGHMDRVIANEVARAMGLEPNEDHDDTVQRAADRSLFQRAGTIAALSEQILTLPYAPWSNELEGTNPSLMPAATRAEATYRRAVEMIRWDEIQDEALQRAQTCTLLREFSKRTEAIFNEIATPSAWVGDYHALRHLHADHGEIHAYLTGLLMQALLSWENDAVFVLAETDRYVLADLAAILVRKRWPRPFAIPDLRTLGPPYARKNHGVLLNLEPKAFSDVVANRRDPALQSYAAAVFQIAKNPEIENVGKALERALRVAYEAKSRHQDIPADITLVLGRARILSNARVLATWGEDDPDCWSRRRFPMRSLRTIVLA